MGDALGEGLEEAKGAFETGYEEKRGVSQVESDCNMQWMLGWRSAAERVSNALSKVLEDERGVHQTHRHPSQT